MPAKHAAKHDLYAIFVLFDAFDPAVSIAEHLHCNVIAAFDAHQIAIQLQRLYRQAVMIELYRARYTN